MPINILMPALSPTMTEGNLARWLKKEGDTVKAGQVLAEIETDKATMEVEAVDEGILAKILVPAGAQGIAVNAPIAILAEEGESIEAATGGGAAPTAARAAPPKAETKPQEAPAMPATSAQSSPSVSHDGGRIFASPLARRVAEQSGVDLKAVAGSGPGGRIVKADVEGGDGRRREARRQSRARSGEIRRARVRRRDACRGRCPRSRGQARHGV